MREKGIYEYLAIADGMKENKILVFTLQENQILVIKVVLTLKNLKN